MRVLRVLAVSIAAFATAAGAVFAADDPLEIHGGGRIGVVANSKGGSQSNILDNSMGTMPNYGESRYWSLSVSKKYTADGGAWAKVSTGIDQCVGDADGDLQSFNLRMRDFHVEFGGLDFLPKDAVLWGGLRGYGAGWNGQQDHSFINFAGVGFGIEKIGGVFSIAYMGQDSKSDQDADSNNAPYTAPATEPADNNKDQNVKGLTEKTMHNIIANINVPMADVYFAYGYSKKSKDNADEKNLSSVYLGGIFHAPVASLNIGAQVSTNSYAREIYFANYDTCLKGDHFGGVAADKTMKYTGASALVWSVTDVMPGLYVAPALRFDYIKAGKETSDATGATADGKDVTFNKIGASFRISKSLTKNIAFVPTLGFFRSSDTGKNAAGDKNKAYMALQGTAAVEISLAQAFAANPKLQFYTTYNKIDKDHKDTGNTLGTAYAGKTSSVVFGMLMTCGF